MCDYFIRSCTYTSPLHPASSSTSIFSLYASLSLYIRPHPLHPSSFLSLYTQPKSLHPAKSSSLILSLYTQPQSLNPSSAATPASASATGLNLFTHPQPLQYTPSLSLYIRPPPLRVYIHHQALHPGSASTFAISLHNQSIFSL